MTGLMPGCQRTTRNWKLIGYGFAVTNVAPETAPGCEAELDAAHNAGIKLIIGLYAFGGPPAVRAERG